MVSWRAALELSSEHRRAAGFITRATERGRRMAAAAAKRWAVAQWVLHVDLRRRMLAACGAARRRCKAAMLEEWRGAGSSGRRRRLVLWRAAQRRWWREASAALVTWRRVAEHVLSVRRVLAQCARRVALRALRHWRVGASAQKRAAAKRAAAARLAARVKVRVVVAAVDVWVEHLREGVAERKRAEAAEAAARVELVRQRELEEEARRRRCAEEEGEARQRDRERAAVEAEEERRRLVLGCERLQVRHGAQLAWPERLQHEATR